MNWRDKAHRIILKECTREYEKANKGKKKHVKYCVPELAEKLIDCLNTDDEQRAKSIFVHDVLYIEETKARDV